MSSRWAALKEQPEANQEEETERDRKCHHLRTEKVLAHLSIAHLSTQIAPQVRARHLLVCDLGYQTT
jgi:hypothetical protein